MERSQYGRQEELLRTLTSAKDQVQYMLEHVMPYTVSIIISFCKLSFSFCCLVHIAVQAFGRQVD